MTGLVTPDEPVMIDNALQPRETQFDESCISVSCWHRYWKQVCSGISTLGVLQN